MGSNEHVIVYDVTDNNKSRQNCQLHPRTATEVVLVDILNIIYPREAQSMTDAPSPTMPPAADSESNPFLPPAGDDLDSMSMPETAVESDPFMPPNAEDESTNTKSLKTLNNVSGKFLFQDSRMMIQCLFRANPLFPFVLVFFIFEFWERYLPFILTSRGGLTRDIIICY
jgi:hypothetical protein